jgi:hypothetical protein
MSLLTQASLVLTPTAYKANKLYSIIPSSGNGDMITTRATTATRVNSSGVIENVATGIPRLDYTGSVPSILLEPQRTNRLLNSATVVTQTISTTGVACTVSFYGTGTITFSGTYIGSLIGIGASNRVSLTFTPTSGNLILTVTGTCTNGQLETGSYATSYIPTTTSTVTRNLDDITKTGVSTDILNPSEGTFYVEISALANDLTARIISVNDGTDYNNIQIQFSSVSNIIRLDTYGQTGVGTFANYRSAVTVANTTTFHKCLIKWSGSGGTSGISMYVDGTKYTPYLATGTGTGIPTALNKIDFKQYWGGNYFYGKCKGMQIYKTALTDAECATLTTL